MKIAALVLVILVVAYIVVSRLGKHDSGSDLKTPDWITNLGNAMSGSFDTSLIGPGCFDAAGKQFIIPAQAACSSPITRGRRDYQKLVLRPLAAAMVKVEYRATTNDGTALADQQLTLPDATHPSIVVRSDGGQLTLTCQNPAARCLVAVE